MSKRSFVPALLVALALPITLVACGGDDDSGAGDATTAGATAEGPLAGKLIWEVDALNSNEVVNAWAHGMNVIFKEAGAKLVRSFAVNQAGQVDLSLQAQGFDRAIAAKPAAIIWLVLDVKAMGPQIRKAQEAGIPVFALYGKPEADVNAFIEARNYDQGYLVGQQLAKALGRGGKVTMITSFPTPNTIAEQAGARKAFEEGGLELVGNPDQQRNLTDIASGGQELMQGILQRFPDLDGVFAYNDPSAIGAIAAIKAAGKDGEIVVASRNGDAAAIEAIKNGDLLATCDIDPITIGQTLAQAIVDHLTGKKTYENNAELKGPPAAEQSELWPDGCLVTKENVDDYKGWDERVEYTDIEER